MTLKELYALIGGDYDQAVRVMKIDKLIDRYVRKLKNSNVGEALSEAQFVAIASVRAATFRARRDNSEHNTLEKAAGGVRI